MQITAAKWYARTADKSVAMTLLEALKASSADEDIRRQLNARIAQVKGLKTIQMAVDLYNITQGLAPKDINDLLDGGYLLVAPVDPFGQGYGLDDQGNAVVLKGGRTE